MGSNVIRFLIRGEIGMDRNHTLTSLDVSLKRGSAFSLSDSSTSLSSLAESSKSSSSVSSESSGARIVVGGVA